MDVNPIELVQAFVPDRWVWGAVICVCAVVAAAVVAAGDRL